MAPTLILNSGNAANGNLSVDVSQYLDLTEDSDMDTYDPGWSNKVLGHSLLREGATLALEDRQAKELTFPLKLNATTRAAVQLLLTQINQVVNTSGATYSWQDTGTSQPTVFDNIIGEFQVKYKYREQERFWVSGDLKLTVQPFGHVTGPRLYAAASGVGPVLMITPYASGSTQQVIGASTQAGASGYGGIGQGGIPSSGVFYTGSPSLIGDAPAQLMISYTGPLPAGASLEGTTPYFAVSVLPDALYAPLITAPQMTPAEPGVFALKHEARAVGSSYWSQTSYTGFLHLSFQPMPAASPIGPAWEGLHRIFAIARSPSSANTGTLTLAPQSGVYPAAADVTSADWGLYDLGTVAIAPSDSPQRSVTMLVGQINSGCLVEVTAAVMLPDAQTWFFNPLMINPEQYGFPLPYTGSGGTASGPWTNTLIIDDRLPTGQYLYNGAPQAPPAPVGAVASAATITAYSRGLVPRPDPRDGLPILAIMGVGLTYAPSGFGGELPLFPGDSGEIVQTHGASWTNTQNLRTMAQVSVLERARYVLP